MPAAAGPRNTWSVAKHDTIPSVELWLNPLETHAYLFAFLASDGEQFLPPYQGVYQNVGKVIDEAAARERIGQAPRRDVTPQRLRTWKAVFESFGLLAVDAGTNQIRLTPFGRAVKGLYHEVNDRIEGANDHMARLAVGILNKHTLRNPVDGDDYPEDTDIRPYRFIWRALRRLDDKLHSEELNRVMLHVLRTKDEDDAIERIRDARRAAGGIYTDANVALLGEPAVDDGDETTRRITPIFTRAGFGGLLIDPKADNAGFRHLVPRYKHLVDEALQDEPVMPADAQVSAESYLRYLTQVEKVDAPAAQPSDEAEIAQVLGAVERHGTRRIICISGIPGTGKSRLAKLVASRITGDDDYRFEEIQFHESTSYDDFMEGFVARPGGDGFELARKTFRTINRRARLDPSGAKYVLLIEEFTRANVHSVLGELITYIEHRERPFHLALSQDEEKVAKNLVVLATMNPRDKSAVVLDHAILRRLHQIRLDPSPDRLRSMLTGKMDAATLDQLVDWFKKYLGVLPFGHAVFAEARTADDLRDLWLGTIRYFLMDVSGQIRETYKVAAEEYPWP